MGFANMTGKFVICMHKMSSSKRLLRSFISDRGFVEHWVNTRDFLHDFFKPFVPTAATLRTMKKNRAGKRLRQLEKLEGKQKEERQRRSRERQREFFKDVEVHK